MQTPREFLLTRVLQKKPSEYARYAKYAKEYPGMKFETKHELGGLISKIRGCHELTGKTDWTSLISEFGGPLIAEALSREFLLSASDETAKDLLLAFGGFAEPCEVLVESIAEIAGALEEMLEKTPEPKMRKLLRAETLAMKRHSEVQRKRLLGDLAGTPDSRHQRDAVDGEEIGNDCVAWMQFPESELAAHLASATFPKSGNVDFLRFFASFLSEAKPVREVHQKKQHVEPSKPEVVIVVDPADQCSSGNPFASNGWSGIFLRASQSSNSNEIVYPKGIKLSNGNSRLSEVVFEEDLEYYPHLPPRELVAVKSVASSQPLAPMGFQPRAEDMTLKDLDFLLGVADKTIQTLEEIREFPWQFPTRGKVETERERKEKEKKAIEEQANADYMDFLEEGTLFMRRLDKKHKASTMNLT